MITYTAENAVLKITNKLHKEAEHKYNLAAGQMRNVQTFGWFLDEVAKFLSLSDRRTIKDGEYVVTIYGSGNGYARSCRFKKLDVMIKAEVEKTASGKFSVISVDFSRIELYAGEYLCDKIRTSGSLTRAMHVARFIGEKDYRNPCWISGLKTMSYKEIKKASKIVWDRFIDCIFDFDV